ncbi:probable glycosyltransferase At5g25310 [Herrania umbratica]|uniref:Probable glycosyltransferase At5g25310 n=1 Tax=Herrania umbratica TaxID=108875 RepID=A0A6J1AB57_9ROSI|nr:probable glycosyltransferase At5g25310 [Herrania umbratica]
MRKLLKHVAVALIRELIRHCRWRKIDWRKLFFAGAVMSIAGVVLPTLLFTYRRSIWFLPSLVNDSSHQSLNGSVHLSNNLTETRSERFQLVPTAPFVSFNSSTEAKGRHRVSRRRRKRRRRSKIDDGPQVIPPPPRRTVSPRLQRYLRSLSPDESLLYAKMEIEHAPAVDNDDDSYLYAPIFRNVSIFERSYELMEMILKVYIYPDGEKPIFHEPHLLGIYASEGWFMKLLEADREFVTQDPVKAHLFYLPYSSRQLELALYVPNSHNLRPLSIFIRDYVSMIAAKYPFWNRTHGSDHFLVACHDWGPYTTSAHRELRNNTIKAVCNADLSENFIAGKDVSLPETAIRNPGRPLRYIGRGNRVSQRPILAFFAGNMHGRVRPKLLKYWHNKEEDMKIYGPLPIRVSRNMTYIQHMKSSKYCICPMGYEVNSPRIVEAIYYECVPVIIADNFVLPFNEVLDWNAFSVIVAEKDIPKLKEILLAIPLRRYLKMQINVKMVQKHFLWNPRPMRYDLFHMILHAIWFNRLNQIQISQD